MPSTLSAKISLCVLIVIIAMALAQSAQAQVETILYNFTGANGDGKYPDAGLAIDSKGNLYGTTSGGGSNAGECGSYGCGIVFEVNTSLGESILHTFTGTGGDGWRPDANNVILDSSGNVYGTTLLGGNSGCNGGGCGIAFKLSTSGTETILHTFASTSGDGSEPLAGLLMDGLGNLYGTTSEGGTGSSECAFGCGTVFKISSAGTESVLYSFTDLNGDGGYPYGDLILDSEGNLYGTTAGGGSSGNGTVFKLSSSGVETVLYSFQGGGSDGLAPQGGLVMDSSGNLYGTTYYGGTSNDGIVFELSSSGKETILHVFSGTNGDGANPDGSGSLILDANGNLYGTTTAGGSSSCNCGIVFKLNISTGVETILHTFAGGADDGSTPTTLIADANGNLYSTTSSGGTDDVGTVFKITLPNFTIAASPTTASVTPGESADSTLTIAPVGDYSAKVTLSCSVPSDKGLSCSVSPTSVTLNGITSEKATLSVLTSATTPAGSYTITAEGLAGLTLSHTTTFTVTVQ